MTAGLYGLDQITKRIVETTMVEGESHQVIGTWVRWTFYRNPGAAFSVGEQMTWLFTLMMVVVGGYVIFLLTRARSAAWLFALCGLLAGILGNLTDRLLRPPGFGVGHVVDFIHVRHFAIFNVADSCICVSIGVIILLILRNVPVAGAAAEETDDAAEPADSEAASNAAKTSNAEEQGAGT